MTLKKKTTAGHQNMKNDQTSTLQWLQEFNIVNIVNSASLPLKVVLEHHVLSWMVVPVIYVECAHPFPIVQKHLQLITQSRNCHLPAKPMKLVTTKRVIHSLLAQANTVQHNLHMLRIDLVVLRVRIACVWV